MANIPMLLTTLLSDQIAESLRDSILDGTLAAGTKLAEEEIATRLGVSRVPLREAFRVLAGEGLVTIEPHRGVRVCQCSDAELLELFEVRAMFEAHAAAILATTRPLATLQELDTMISNMKLALKQSASQDYLILAERFHDTLVSQCGNRLLKKLYDQIRLNIRRYQSVMAQLPGSPKQSIKEHEQIVAAIRAGDSDTASAQASAHITALVNRFEEHRQKISKTKAAIKL